MPLTFNVIPGKVFASGELVTTTKLNQLGAPTIEVLDDDITFIVADGSITTAKLADAVLTADVAGRAKMADGYVTDDKLDTALDLTGKTLSGNPTVNWTGAVTLTGAVNLAAATVTLPPELVGEQVASVASTTAAIGTLTSAGVGTGVFSGATSGTIPVDDTLPQINEGAAVAALAVAITPQHVDNILELELRVQVHISSTANTVVAALFQDADIDAIAATYLSGVNDAVLVLTHRLVAGTTSPIDFTVRFGVTGGTLTVNGRSGARLLGGAVIASLIVREIAG
jgi:hypothetical protein